MADGNCAIKFIFVLGMVAISYVNGLIHLEVKPYPALIYSQAEPGVPVLNIVAYDVTDDAPLGEVSLTGPDTDYFQVRQQLRLPKEWVLLVKKQINKHVGYVFDFTVYGNYNGSLRDRNIKINVTHQNLHPPSFEREEYEFIAYRYPFDQDLTLVGNVKAIDRDTQPYNSVFHYHILDPIARGIFDVDLETGDIEIIGNFPPDAQNVTFNVTAIDGGSPQLLNSTRVIVHISDLAPPDIFCVAVEDSIARICWKDPTNGSYVMKYELLFKLDGQNTTTIPVNVQGIRDETCSIVRGPQLHRNYTFTVKVYNGLEVSPESLQRKVIVTRKGLYGDCPMFSNCSVWEPCKNKGECLVNSDLSYTCNCTEGWGGQNCTAVDLCPTNPCNSGSCLFRGHEDFQCQCPSDMYGKYCQFYNQCSDSPCKNHGVCLTQPDGSYTCQCSGSYVGTHCETRDPCVISPCQHGTCNGNGEFNFTCSCKYGYYGDLCDMEDTCTLVAPCGVGNCFLFNDTESANRTTNYYCECSQGYSGEHCENFNPCEIPLDSKLCKNNATCVQNVESPAGFKCMCLPGYWGEECQYYNACLANPCGQHGKCLNTSTGSFKCACDHGYYGSLCEYFNPCSSNPCVGESSRCHFNISSTEYSCECPEGRHGRNCENIDGCQDHNCQNNGICVNTSDTGTYTCRCQSGYVGQFCDLYDSCSLLPCQNGTCRNNGSREYTCDCHPGFRGNHCELIDPCVSNPCLNHGICTHGVKNTYWCACIGKFFGDMCQKLQFCEIREQCYNGGSCVLTNITGTQEVTVSLTVNQIISANVSNGFSCVCPPTSTGTHCEHVLTACSSNPCGPGHCIEKGSSYICQCPDGTNRTNCHDDVCESEDMYDATGRYRWPRTLSGEESRILCPYGPRELIIIGHYNYARRMCSPFPNGTTGWHRPDTSECKEMKPEEASTRLQSLATLTGDAAHLNSDEIASITKSLEDVFALSFQDKQIAYEMTRVMGNLLEANESVLIESNNKNHSTERLLWLLEQYTSEVPTTDVTSVVTDNINLMVVNLSGTHDQYRYTPELGTESESEQTELTVEFPAEAITETDGVGTRIELMTFRTSSFFIPEEEAPKQEVVMKQWVISATVHGRQLNNLTTPVELIIKNIADGVNHTCVFWDAKNRSWSTEGMVTKLRGRNYTRCYSYHLTSFAIVLDPSPTHLLPAEHERVLTYISYIGCGISILGLLMTILTYSLFRCLNREKSGKILMNLCSSMLLMNAIFILGSETSSTISGDALCKAVAVLLHYFLLTTLMWMCVEAINMYQALIKVFTKYSRYFMLKRCLGAWGIPAIIVIIILSINVDNYKTTTTFCFLSHGNPLAFYIGLLGPACLILLINMAVFIMVARVILRPKFKGQVGSSDSINPAQIRGAFTVMTLLGVTWVFGPFAINEAKLVVNYVFTILNSLQGFLIFVFRCCFNPEARMAWIMLIKTGKLKRRKGPMKNLASENTTSSKGETKNGSFAETMKTNVYNSFGKQRNGVLNNDRNLDTQNHNNISKASKTSKDLNTYFDDLQKFRNGEHTGITTIYTGRQNGVRRYSIETTGTDELTKL